jgi:hypothetical protein
MSAPVLLTVSGTIPDDLRAAIAAGRRPRTDYVEMAAAFDAELLDRSGALGAAGIAGPLLQRLGPNIPLVWASFRRGRRHRVVFTDGEQVGIPYAALTWLGRARPRHVMIGHVLSPRKKALLHRVLRLHRRVDAVVVYSSAQRRFALDELGYRPEQVVIDIPANVTARGYDLFALRQLYADAAIVVVPLQETDFQAGITTILEAMSMGKPVVCTLTTGQTDTIVDGETGIYVAPGDAAGMRAAIERLLADPTEADRLGANARAWVVANAGLDGYVARLKSLLA